MTPESKAAVLAQIEAIFRRMLAAGKPVAIEDARRRVPVPDWFNPSCLGGIVRRMKDAGEIVLHSYRRSDVASRHAGIARLWVLADAPTVKPGKGVARG